MLPLKSEENSRSESGKSFKQELTILALGWVLVLHSEHDGHVSSQNLFIFFQRPNSGVLSMAITRRPGEPNTVGTWRMLAKLANEFLWFCEETSFDFFSQLMTIIFSSLLRAWVCISVVEIKIGWSHGSEHPNKEE